MFLIFSGVIGEWREWGRRLDWKKRGCDATQPEMEQVKGRDLGLGGFKEIIVGRCVAVGGGWGQVYI